MATQEPGLWNADKRELSRTSQAGLGLFSSTLQVVYLSPEARVLLQEFALRQGPSTDLPPAIQSFCQEVMQTLPTTPESTAWEGLRHSRVTSSRSRPMLLHAFGVPAPGHDGDGQLLLLIEPAQPTSHALAPHSPPITPMYLTRREQSVTWYLLEGLTNKELANKLRLSEHTVKDHLKRLMKKARVTTRTAVVSRLLSDHRLLAQLANATVPSADQDIHDLAV